MVQRDYSSPMMKEMQIKLKRSCFVLSDTLCGSQGEGENVHGFRFSRRVLCFFFFFCFLFFFFFLLFAFGGRTLGIWKFPGKGSNQSYSCRPQPQPQPQPLRIQAAYVTNAPAHGNS